MRLKTFTALGAIALFTSAQAQVVNSGGADLEFTGLDNAGAFVKAEGLTDGKPVGYLELKGDGEKQVTFDYDFGNSGTTKATVLFIAKGRVIRAIQDNSGPAPVDIEIDEHNTIANATITSEEDWWQAVLAALIYCSRVEFHAESYAYGQVGWSVDVGIGCGGGLAPVDVTFNGTLVPGVTTVVVVPTDGNLSNLGKVEKISLTAGGGARINSAR